MYFPILNKGMRPEVRLILAALIALLIPVLIFGVQKLQVQRDVLCKKCSVVFVDIDILRADELPCYGYHRNTAPNLCKFAGQSTMFQQNYSQSNWHLSSLFSTITSLYPWAHGVNTEFTDSLSPAVPTMAELFRANGYNTAYYGARLFINITSNNGGERGYDSFYEYPDDRQKILTDLLDKNQPFFIHFSFDGNHSPYLLENEGDQIEILPKPKGLPITHTEFDIALGDYLKKNYKKIFTERAIRENPELFSGTAPNVSLELANFYKLSRQSAYGQRTYLLSVYGHPDNAYMQFIDTNNPAHVAYLRMLYDSKIKQMDDRTAQFWAFLSSVVKKENVVVVIASRLGDAFGEHGTFSHDFDPYSEIYYTPLIIRVPGQKPGSTNIASENIDILPTLLDIVGLPPAPQSQGQSLVPIIRGQNPNEHRYAVGEMNVDEILTIQDDRWMLLWQASVPGRLVELYDKHSDPKERMNIAGLPQYREQEDTLFSLLKTIRNKTALPLSNPPSPALRIDEKISKWLKRVWNF